MKGYSEDFRRGMLRETEEFLSRHLNHGADATPKRANGKPSSGIPSELHEAANPPRWSACLRLR